jgi:hypothetical protein
MLGGPRILRWAFDLEVFEIKAAPNRRRSSVSMI